MRTSRLGRWVIRGALVAATVALGAASASVTAAGGDYTWGNAPVEAQVNAEDEATHSDTGREENDDYTWG